MLLVPQSLLQSFSSVIQPLSSLSPLPPPNQHQCSLVVSISSLFSLVISFVLIAFNSNLVDQDGVLKVWDATDGRYLGECTELRQQISPAVCMTPLILGHSSRPSMVAVGGASRSMFIVDVASRKVVTTFTSHGDWLTCLSSTSKPATAVGLASLGKDGMIGLWRVPESLSTIVGPIVSPQQRKAVADEFGPLARIQLTVDTIFGTPIGGGGGGSGVDDSGDHTDEEDSSSSSSSIPLSAPFPSSSLRPKPISFGQRLSPQVIESDAEQDDDDDDDEEDKRLKPISVQLSNDGLLLAIVFPTCWVLFSTTGECERLVVVRPPLPDLSKETASNHGRKRDSSLVPNEQRTSMSNSGGGGSGGGSWAGGCFTESKSFISWTEAGVGCVYALDKSTTVTKESSRSKYTARLLYCMNTPQLHPKALESIELRCYGWTGSTTDHKFCFANGSVVATWDMPEAGERIPTPGTPTAIPPPITLSSNQGGGGSSYGSVGPFSAAASLSYDKLPFFGDMSAFGNSFTILPSPGMKSSSPPYSSYTPLLNPFSLSNRRDTVPFSSSGYFAWPTLPEDRSSITCCCVLEDIFVLICGHDNGEVSCTTLPSDPFTKRFKAHDKCVTALLAPSPSMSEKSRFLVTAGGDFCIKVWDLFSFELRHSFYMHSAAILRLVPLTPPPLPPNQADNNVTLRHSFLSIGAGFCVGIFSLDTMTCQHWLYCHKPPITPHH